MESYTFVSLLKRGLLILLSVVILMPSLCKTGVMIWFKANQDYIASVLCINRNNEAKSYCSGCCVLNEKLSKISEEQQGAKSGNNHIKTESEWQWISDDAHNGNITIATKENLYRQAGMQHLPDADKRDVFHPPRV